MRIQEITQTGLDGKDARIDFIRDDGSTDAMLMSGDVAFSMMTGLFDVAARLHRSGLHQRAPSYELIGCAPITTEGGQQGLALMTEAKFDIVVTITAEMLAILRSCMQQVEKNLKDGQVH